MDNQISSRKGKKILYIGNVGNTGTSLMIHALNVAKLFRKIGYETTFLCNGCKGRKVFYEEHEGFPYFYTRFHLNIPKISFFEWIIDELTGWKYIPRVLEIINNNRPDIIIFYGTSCETQLIKIARKYNIPLILERVDWFEKDNYTSIHDKYLLTPVGDYIYDRKDPLADGIIAISPYLYSYYSGKCKNVIWLPPIFEINKDLKISRYSHRGKIHLVYAGSLGGTKDKILPLLNVIRKINGESVYISIDLVGVSYEDLYTLTGLDDWNYYGVTARSRCSNQTSRDIVSKADFSVLLRDKKLYAKAGFSTKFAESMSLGVPVICTQVGGADSVICDMRDGVLIPDNSESTIENKLRLLLMMDENKILEMKENAFKKACDVFALDSHTAEINTFVKKLNQASPCIDEV